MGGLVGGWIGGWMDVKVVLRTACQQSKIDANNIFER